MELADLSTQMLIGVGLVIAILGMLLGWAIGRRTSAAGKKYRDVERKLDQVLQDKKLYEDEVVEHFSETAALLNNLNDSYRDVHKHLAKGAANLCQGEGPVALEQPSSSDPSDIPPKLAHAQQPLDYAPKSSPHEKGMLNEEFGLDRNAETPESPDADEQEDDQAKV